MELRQHPFVKDRYDANSVRPSPIKHDVTTALLAKQALADFVARATELRIMSEILAATLERSDVSLYLRTTPSLERVSCNAAKVVQCSRRKTVMHLASVYLDQARRAR